MLLCLTIASENCLSSLARALVLTRLEIDDFNIRRRCTLGIYKFTLLKPCFVYSSIKVLQRESY